MNAGKQVRQGHAKGIGDSANDYEAGVSVPAFNPRQIGGVQLCSVCKFFLRETTCASELLQAPAECLP